MAPQRSPARPRPAAPLRPFMGQVAHEAGSSRLWSFAHAARAIVTIFYFPRKADKIDILPILFVIRLYYYSTILLNTQALFDSCTPKFCRPWQVLASISGSFLFWTNRPRCSALRAARGACRRGQAHRAPAPPARVFPRRTHPRGLSPQARRRCVRTPFSPQAATKKQRCAGGSCPPGHRCFAFCFFQKLSRANARAAPFGRAPFLCGAGRYTCSSCKAAISGGMSCFLRLTTPVSTALPSFGSTPNAAFRMRSAPWPQ